MLGASNNEYIGSGAGSSAEGIDYNYGTGWSAKVDLALELYKYGRLLFRWAHYKLWTLEGVDGTDRLNLFQARYRLPVYKGLGAGARICPLPPQFSLCRLSGCKKSTCTR